MQATQALEQLISKAQKDGDVLAVLLFGSTARGEPHSSSDVDICLILRPGTPEPSQKRLAYLTDFDLDIRIFQQIPLYVRRRVLQEGRILLSKDDDALYELAFRTARAFEDFKPSYQCYLEAVLRD